MYLKMTQNILNHVSKPESETDSGIIRLDSFEINSNPVLSTIYYPSAIYLTSASFQNETLTANCRWFTPECYKISPSHLTRIQIVTYIGQASYLFGYYASHRGLLAGLNRHSYIHKMKNDLGTFKHLQLDFKKFISPKDEFEIKVSPQRNSQGKIASRSLRGMSITRLNFSLDNESCLGSGDAIIFL